MTTGSMAQVQLSGTQDARTDAEAPRRPYSTVHVVTVLYNNADTLRPFLQALVASASRITGLTLVDNGSEDGSRALADELARTAPIPVEVLPNDNDGFAGGYRAAGRSVIRRGIPVLCLNPDVELSEDAIDHLLDAMNAVPQAAVVTLPLVESDGVPDTASRRRLPNLSGSIVYSLLGRFTPTSLRYNNLSSTEGRVLGRTQSDVAVTSLEATTGALMLVDPAFRTLDDGIFDTDYWMYGEDLQLCRDALLEGRSVAMVECPPSIHVKGVSSGRPRSTFSNKAFHDAMYVYARKNLLSGRVLLAAFRLAVTAHFALSETLAAPKRRRLHSQRPGAWRTTR